MRKLKKAYRANPPRTRTAKRLRIAVSRASARKQRKRMMDVANRIMDEDRDFLRELARQ